MKRLNNKTIQRGIPYGFTVIEVMVALCVLSVSLMAVFGAVRSCTAAAFHADMLNRSVTLAERLLTETTLKGVKVFETQNGRDGLYTWQIRITPTPIDTLGAIHIIVQWQEQQREQTYDLYSLVHMELGED